MGAGFFARSLGWLVRDTFRQSLATRLFWIMLAVGCVCILFCLSVSVDAVNIRDPDPNDREIYLDESGRVSLGFGLYTVNLFRDHEAMVKLIQAALALGVGGALGTILVLVWTGGFLPEFLQPSSVSVLLAKPAPRSWLLLGKYAGVVAFVAFQFGILIGGTWLALGARTGVWNGPYLWAWPILTAHFAMIHAVSVLIAVMTRNTVATIFGTILFWGICLGVNYGWYVTSDLAVITTPRGAVASTSGATPGAESESGAARSGDGGGSEAEGPASESESKSESKSESESKSKSESKSGSGSEGPPSPVVSRSSSAIPNDEPPPLTREPRDLDPEELPRSETELNVGRQSETPAADRSRLTPRLIAMAHWLLPKPVDFIILLEDVIGSRSHLESFPELRPARDAGRHNPWAALGTSFLFAIVALFVAAREFDRVDY